MSTITSAQLIQTFEKLKSEGKTAPYVKSGRFLARPITSEDEFVLTIVAGKLETIHTGKKGEIVVQNIMLNSSAERYVMAEKTFLKRYEPTGNSFNYEGTQWFEVEAQGIAEGICVSSPLYFSGLDNKNSFTIPAPWAGGEDMVVNAFDWILRPILADLSVPNLDDIQRVEKATFERTYVPFFGEEVRKRLARLQKKAGLQCPACLNSRNRLLELRNSIYEDCQTI